MLTSYNIAQHGVQTNATCCAQHVGATCCVRLHGPYRTEHCIQYMPPTSVDTAHSMGLMHDDVLLISFTTTPRSQVVSAHFFHISCWYSFKFLSSGKHLHFECEAWCTGHPSSSFVMMASNERGIL